MSYDLAVDRLPAAPGPDLAALDSRPARDRAIDPGDFVARFVVGVLFVFLSINLLADFRKTHAVTGLLLLVSEALVVVLTIARRRATLVDRSRTAALVTTVSMVGPPLLRAYGSALLPDAVTASLSAAGLSLVIAAKLALGRSFGLVPANRGIIARGPYQLVRHPIYVGYLLTHIGFVLAHPRWTNIAAVVVSDAALIARAFLEERTLKSDGRYREYCSRVRWRLVPGLV